MVANLLNIQEVFPTIPNTFTWEGQPFDDYPKWTEKHIAHGWVEFIEPTFNPETQKLSDLVVMKDGKATRDVIELTSEEIEANYRKTIPESIQKMDLKIQLIKRGIELEDVISQINDIPDFMFSEIDKKIAIIKFDSAVSFDRYNADLNLIATLLGLSQIDLDNIFLKTL